MRSRTALTLSSLALATALAACGGGKSDEVQASDQAQATSTTVAGAPTTSGGAAGGVTGAGGTTATTAASSSAGAQASGAGTGSAATGGSRSSGSGTSTKSAGGSGTAVGQAAAPAQPGRYEYATSGETTTSGAVQQHKQLPATTALTVDAADGGRQRSVRDMRDGNNEGSVTTTVLRYESDGVKLEDLKIQATVSGFTATYEFKPSSPQMIAKTGAGVGSHLAFSLDSTDGGIHAQVTVDVLRRETVTIGGTAVDTFLVRTHTTFSGDIQGESTSDANVSPARSLTVKEHSVSDATFGVTTSHTDATSTLKSLTPA